MTIRYPTADPRTSGSAFMPELRQALGDLRVASGTRVNVTASPWLALGDGSTDDTNAINDAQAFLQGLGGGELYFPSGDADGNPGPRTYIGDALDALTENITWVGDGPGLSTIKRMNGGSTRLILMGSTGNPGGNLKNLTIDGNFVGAPTGHYEIILVQGDDCIFENVETINGASANYVCSGNRPHWLGCTMRGPGGTGTLTPYPGASFGVQFASKTGPPDFGGSDYVFDKCNFYGFKLNAIIGGGAAGNLDLRGRITNCFFSGNGAMAQGGHIAIGNFAAPTTVNHLIENCRFEIGEAIFATWVCALELNGGVSVVNCHADGQGVMNAGIVMQANGNMTAVGGGFKNFWFAGIWVLSGVTDCAADNIDLSEGNGDPIVDASGNTTNSWGAGVVGLNYVQIPPKNVGIAVLPTARLDVTSGNQLGSFALLLGSDLDLDSRTNASFKNLRIGLVHYTIAEEPVGIVVARSTTTENFIRIGGGSSFTNAATSVSIYTAANQTTTTGTERVKFDSAGNVGIGWTSSLGTGAERVVAIANGGVPTLATLPTGTSLLVTENVVNNLLGVQPNGDSWPGPLGTFSGSLGSNLVVIAKAFQVRCHMSVGDEARPDMTTSGSDYPTVVLTVKKTWSGDLSAVDPTMGLTLSKRAGCSVHTRLNATVGIPTDEFYGIRSYANDIGAGTYGGQTMAGASEFDWGGTSNHAVLRGHYSLINKYGSGNLTGYGRAQYSKAQVQSTSGGGTIAAFYGSENEVNLAGPCTVTVSDSCHAAFFLSHASASVGTHRYYRVGTPAVTAGTLTKLVGLSVADLSGVGAGTHRAIEVEGANSICTVAGKSSFGSTTAPVSKVSVLVAPDASANYGSVSIGNSPFDGAASGKFVGSANGTHLAINGPSGSTADYLNFQKFGVHGLRITHEGEILAAGSLGLATPEISITGTATATVGKTHVCSGTSSDYTVTLPAASGNAGKLIEFRMSTALTKLVTLDGNSSETIDGSLTRIMWAGESAILYCDGSNWFKIAGKSIAMVGGMHLGAAGQSGIVTATMTKINLNVSDANSGGMTDTTNSRFNILRPGNYSLYGQGWFNTLASTTGLIAIFKGGSLLTQSYGLSPSSSYNLITKITLLVAALVAGDQMDLRLFQNSGGNATASGDATFQLTYLQISEIPSW